MLKLLGAVLIISATTYFSMCISVKRRVRAEQLSLLAALAEDFINEIRYRSTPCEVLLEKYPAKKQYAALKGLNFEELSLNEEEKTEASEFFMALGRSDLETQIHSLECFSNNIKSIADSAGRKLDSQIRITNSIGFFVGVFISLLIL